MSIASVIYQSIFRRNAVFLTSIFTGAFAFEVAFDSGSNKMWDTINRNRQWKDIKHMYINKDDEEDEDDD